MGAQHGESDGLPATCLGAPFDRFLGERRGEIQQRDDLRVVESREGGILEVDHLRLLLGDMAPVREGHGQVPQGTGPEIVGLEENGHQTGGQLADDQRLLAAVDEQDKVIDEARELLWGLAGRSIQVISAADIRATHQSWLILTVKVRAPKNLASVLSLDSRASAINHACGLFCSSCRCSWMALTLAGLRWLAGS